MSCPWWSPAFFSCLFMKNLWKNRKCGWTHGAASHLFHVKLHPTLTSNVDTSISTNWWICEGILSQGMWIQWFGQKISPKLLPSQASRLLSVLNMKLESLNTHTSPPQLSKSRTLELNWFFSDFYLERTTSPPSLHKPYFNLLRFFFSRKKNSDTLLESHPFSCLLPKLPAGNYVLLYLLLPLHTNQGSHKSIAPLLDLVGKLGTPPKRWGMVGFHTQKKRYTNWTSNWGDFSSCTRRLDKSTRKDSFVFCWFACWLMPVVNKTNTLQLIRYISILA